MKIPDKAVLAELCAYGFVPYGRTPPARIRAAKELPNKVAEALACAPDKNELETLGEQLRTLHWPALMVRNAGATGHGWCDFITSAAVVMELVFGTLPADMAKALAKYPEIEQQFSRMRLSFQRFAMLVDGKAHPVRMFVACSAQWLARTPSLVCPADIDRCPEIQFSIRNADYEGKSHTLLLALLALDRSGVLSLPRDVPIAATGALGRDGYSIEPVGALAEKRQAWFEHEPRGLFLSAPLRSISDIRALLRSPHSTKKREWLQAPETDDPAWNAWIVAGSLHEAAAKLATWLMSRNRNEPGIPSWDGKLLRDDDITPPNVEWDHSDSRPSSTLAYNDAILSTVWHLVGERPECRGIIIYGEPGIGKSVFSHLLIPRFTTGLLGSLGFAVRRSARKFAEAIEAMPGAPLADLLGWAEPERLNLFQNLVAQKRLFLILDGLDEVAARLLPQFARAIVDANAWFIATSRDVRQGHDALPPHVCLKIPPLSREQAFELLKKFNRDDLREQIDRVIPSYGSRDKELNPIATLCRTPFHLRLLASSVPKGVRVGDIDLFDLYRRAFEGLLAQAVDDGRLRADQADLLRRQGRAAIGELAIAWLKSARGTLTDEEIAARLSLHGFEGRDAIDMQRALEFGYLLAPGADNVEFSHRTLAEWAAASALSTRVHRRVAQHEMQQGPVRCADLARIEESELAPFWPDDVPLHDSRFQQVIRFYASKSLAPFGLVEKIVGPSVMQCWKDEEQARRAYAAAMDIAACARWSEQEEGQLIFALFVRAWLFTVPEKPQYGPSILSDHPNRERFVRAVGAYIPDDIGALIDLIARTPQQKATLQADPTMLLRFCPAERHKLFEPILYRGSPKQQAAILKRYNDWNIEPPWDLACQLAEELPARINSAQPPVEPTPVNAIEIIRSSMAGRSSEQEAFWELVSSLKEIESAVYCTSLRLGRSLPWPTLRARLEEWPHHLENALLEWFREGRPAFNDRYDEHAQPEHVGHYRREAFSLLVTRLGETDEALAQLCRSAATSPMAPAIACQLHRRIDNEDSNEPWWTFAKVARRAGWNVDEDRRQYNQTETPEAAIIEDHFRRYLAHRLRVSKVVRALTEANRLDLLLEQLWPVWVPRSKERNVLVDIFIAERRLPLCVDAPEVLPRVPMSTFGIPYELQPCNWKKIEAKHESQWRNLARTGTGRDRFVALLWCGDRDGVADIDAMTAALPDADSELRQLIIAELQRISTHAVPSQAPDHTQTDIADLPLAYRARVNAHGWREKLLETIANATNTDQSLHDLLRIVKEHRVHDALPLLIALFQSRRDVYLGGIIGELLNPEDRATVRLLIGAGMAHALPDRALETLSIDELRLMLSSKDEPFFYGTKNHWKHVLALGPAAHTELRAAFTRHQTVLRQTEGPKSDLFPSREIPHDASRWVNVLGPLVLQTVDVANTAMRDIVTLLFDIVTGDRHEITSTPGPLGSDFDEPHDREYSSHLVASGTIKAAKELIDHRLELHPDENGALERLLEHPSETLHIYAFETLAQRIPQHEVARLAIKAIDAHVRSTDTRMQGETIGVLLARTVQGGSGSIDIHIPEVGPNLAKAVRKRLTHADREVLAELTKHPQIAVRALACQWIGELGTPEWAPALVPSIEDASPRVAMAALQALNELDATLLVETLGVASRARWIGQHYRAFMNWYMQPRGSRFDFLLQKRSTPPKKLPGATLHTFAVSAIEAACAETPKAWRDWAVPSQLERFIQKVDKDQPPPREGAYSNEWLQERARRATGEVQAALYRVLRQRDAVEIAEDLLAMATAEDPTKMLIAAEILPTLGLDIPAGPWIEKWDKLLAGDNLRSTIYEHWPRLLAMLERAPVAYAPLLPHLLQVVRTDLEGSLTEESEDILSRLSRLLKKWGPEAAKTLIEMIESGRRDLILNNWSEAENLLLDAYGKDPDVVAQLRKATGNAPDVQWKFREYIPQDTVMAALRRKLHEEILPGTWTEAAR